MDHPGASQLLAEFEGIQPRVTGDWANHVIADESRLWLGSGGDDTVRCLDTRSGRPSGRSWRTARCATHRAGGWSPVFGSDDGHVYCLDAGTGSSLA